MSTKSKVITATIAALGLSLIVANGSIGSAFAASDQERYDIGHHDGAMKGGYDEQVGIYNDNCYRLTPGPHTDAYCNGYHDGYYQNWYIYKNRNLHTINVQSGQSISQKSQINCFLAICHNHISQKASQDSNINNQN
jgi:hypothetical protein